MPYFPTGAVRRRTTQRHDASVEVLVHVPHSAVVRMLVDVNGMSAPVTFLDAAYLPHRSRNTPCDEKKADDDVTQDAEVEAGPARRAHSLRVNVNGRTRETRGTIVSAGTESCL